MRFSIEIPDELVQNGAPAAQSSSGAARSPTIYAAVDALSGGAGPGSARAETANSGQAQREALSGGGARSAEEDGSIGTLTADGIVNGGAAPSRG